jgi:hypothetical protein
VVSLVQITRARIREAADVLAVAMLDDGFGQYLAPDLDERLTINRAYYAELIGLAISEGRVDAWGDPIVGVAVWLDRPAVADGEHRSALTVPAFDGPALLAPEVAARVERFGAVIRQLSANGHGPTGTRTSTRSGCCPTTDVEGSRPDFSSPAMRGPMAPVCHAHSTRSRTRTSSSTSVAATGSCRSPRCLVQACASTAMRRHEVGPGPGS